MYSSVTQRKSFQEMDSDEKYRIYKIYGIEDIRNNENEEVLRCRYTEPDDASILDYLIPNYINFPRGKSIKYTDEELQKFEARFNSLSRNKKDVIHNYLVIDKNKLLLLKWIIDFVDSYTINNYFKNMKTLIWLVYDILIISTIVVINIGINYIFNPNTYHKIMIASIACIMMFILFYINRAIFDISRFIDNRKIDRICYRQLTALQNFVKITETYRNIVNKNKLLMWRTTKKNKFS
jgi:hypothetical protein